MKNPTCGDTFHTSGSETLIVAVRQASDTHIVVTMNTKRNTKNTENYTSNNVQPLGCSLLHGLASANKKAERQKMAVGALWSRPQTHDLESSSWRKLGR
jgi:hypothetical protein